MDFANKSILALITGASRGFGRSISEALLRTATAQRAHRLALVLQARSSSEAALTHVETTMMARYLTEETRAISTALSITILPLDLESEDVGERASRAIEIAKQALDAPVDHAILFNNAGLRRPGEVGSGGFAAGLAESLAVNVAAPAALSIAFLDALPDCASRRLVLTSSFAAVKPVKSWAAYSSSKAAAEMLHACLALERPDVRVLCYAPERMCTAMNNYVPNNEAIDVDMRKPYTVLDENGHGDVERSADKLMEVLQRDQFQSGEHIDFYEM